VDEKKNLIPIDHGASLTEPKTGGNVRIASALAGPHNALLRFPGAHQPLSDKMLKKLKAIDPEAFRDGLRRDRDTIAGEHGSMKDMVTDEALESARRSAQFVKMAAKHKPPLSPATIQVALGCAANELLDPAIDDRTFRQRAQEALERM